METLEKLLAQSNDSNSSTWKWVLGIVISLVIVFIEWKLKSQATEIAVFEAERAMIKEKTVDLSMQLENEKNKAVVEMLKDEIGRLQADMAHRTVGIYAAKKDLEEKKSRVKKAKKWKDLEKLAGRR